MVKDKKQIKATKEKGSLSLNEQIHQLSLENTELRKIIDQLQKNNKKLREQISDLKKDAQDLLLYP